MLVIGADGGLTDAHVRALPDFLDPRDALVVNDTRVIAARLDGVRVRDDSVASIEATLIERVDDCRWRALVRPAKRLKIGERIRFGEASESMACLLAALDAEGIVYRLPPPGGRITGGVLEANVAYGDLVVEYRETGGGWKRYYGAVAVKAPVALRSVSPDGRRVSRTVSIQ